LYCARTLTAEVVNRMRTIEDYSVKQALRKYVGTFEWGRPVAPLAGVGSEGPSA